MPRMTAAKFQASLTKPKREKYRRAPKEDRTWNGVVYDSKAEMVYHQMNPTAWRAPVSLELAGGVKYKPDFSMPVIADDYGHILIDVKGSRTPAYNLKLRLYAASNYANPLHEVKAKYRRGKIVGFETVRVIVPGQPVPRVMKKKRDKSNPRVVTVRKA